MKMNTLFKRTVLFLLFIFLQFNIKAQDKDNPWVISFGLNAVDFYPTNINGMVSENGVPTSWYDQFFNLNEHYNYIVAPTQLSLGRYISESFTIELSGSINKLEKIGSIKLDESVSYLALDANAIYNFNKIIGKTGKFEPFGIAGVGFNSKGNSNKNKLNLNNGASFNSGVGLKYWVFEKIGVKVQTAYKHFFNDGAFPHFQHSASFIYKFGGYDEDNDGVYDRLDKCPEVFGLEKFEGCPDSDNDGIPDSEDDCPTVFGVVELRGCPDADGDGVTDQKDRCPFIKGLAKFDGCPDTDGDGLIDQFDACPTIAGPVSNNGCPEPDSDGDGVPDKIDKCKFEAGSPSFDGCPDNRKEVEEKLTKLVNNILFVSGSDKFYDEYEDELNQIAELMMKNNQLKFQIQGHTDNVGTEEANYQLSLKRVNKILSHLVTKGVNQLNLNVKGFGETMPIDTNFTPEGRAKNRRVEIKIID